jgi:MFS family permease
MSAIMLTLVAVVSAVSSINLATPSIARDLHATQTQITWIVDAYALVFAALLLLADAIGDRYGRRRALIPGLARSYVGSEPVLSMLTSRNGWFSTE